MKRLLTALVTATLFVATGASAQVQRIYEGEGISNTGTPLTPELNVDLSDWTGLFTIGGSDASAPLVWNPDTGVLSLNVPGAGIETMADPSQGGSLILSEASNNGTHTFTWSVAPNIQGDMGCEIQTNGAWFGLDGTPSACPPLWNRSIGELGGITLTAGDGGATGDDWDVLLHKTDGSGWTNQQLNMSLLKDTDIVGTPGVGQVLFYTDEETWKPEYPTVESLNGVDLTNVDDDFAIVWDEDTQSWDTKFVPGIVSAGVILAEGKLEDLSDVAIDSPPYPIAGESLVWNGTAWINQFIGGSSGGGGNFSDTIQLPLYDPSSFSSAVDGSGCLNSDPASTVAGTSGGSNPAAYDALFCFSGGSSRLAALNSIGLTAVSWDGTNGTAGPWHGLRPLEKGVWRIEVTPQWYVDPAVDDDLANNRSYCMRTYVGPDYGTASTDAGVVSRGGVGGNRFAVQSNTLIVELDPAQNQTLELWSSSCSAALFNGGTSPADIYQANSGVVVKITRFQ